MNDKNQAENIALRRCEILGPLLGADKDKALQVLTRKKIAEENGVSERTLRRWLEMYEESGFRGLIPAERGSAPQPASVTEELVDAAVILRREVPGRSVADIIKILEMEGRTRPGEIKRSTLQDRLEKRGYGRRQLSMYYTGATGASRRFQRSLRNELWQADIKYLMKIRAPGGEMIQLYASAFIDDATRQIVGLNVYEHQKDFCVLDCFRTALEAYGLPDELYTDNGRQYTGRRLKHACLKLGIRIMHAKPYCAASKGKIEAFNKTLDKFVAEALLKHPRSAAEVQHELDAWLSELYRRQPHSALSGRTPEQAFNESRRDLRFASPDELNAAFAASEQRLVDKTGCISFRSRLWDVGSDLIGLKVDASYSADNPDVLTVSHPLSEPRCVRPLKPAPFIRRREKAAAEVKAATSRALDAAHEKHRERRAALGATNFRNLVDNQDAQDREGGGQHV